MHILRTVSVALFVSVWCHTAQASVIYGSLGNFDAINDTGSVAHGFEIELDGCLPGDVLYTFGAPYNRYGDPTVTTDGTNTFVRYQSTYDPIGGWAVGTDSGTLPDTGGHSLFNSQYGGDPNYPNVPGDHFGISTSVTPTNTVYHWLLDGGSGTLMLAGTPVRLPAPVLTLAPAVNPGNPAAVQAVIQAPLPGLGQEFGDAIWAKVFTTVVENAGPVQLEDLVVGNPNVPGETETEIEWYLLQSSINGPGEKIDQADVGNGNESVTRRYEFYDYIGPYDQETHEALNDVYDAALVGNFLGNQNVAVNFALDVAEVPEPSTLLLGAFGALGMVMASRRRRRSTAPAADRPAVPE